MHFTFYGLTNEKIFEKSKKIDNKSNEIKFVWNKIHIGEALKNQKIIYEWRIKQNKQK